MHPQFKHLLYIYSGILFTLFVGVIIIWLLYIPFISHAQAAFGYLDRLSIYFIIILSIIGILLFFNLKRLWDLQSSN